MSQTDLSTKLEQLLPHLFEAQDIPGEPYLRLQVTPEISGIISMEKVQETLVVPSSQITPIPNMKPSFMGLMNANNSVFSVFDLAHSLNLSTFQSSSQFLHIIIVRLSLNNAPIETLLGFSVQRILGLTRLSQDSLQTPTMGLPPCLTSFVSGCFFENNQQILSLDLNAITNACL